jgi:hypothetical protein
LAKGGRKLSFYTQADDDGSGYLDKEVLCRFCQAKVKRRNTVKRLHGKVGNVCRDCVGILYAKEAAKRRRRRRIQRGLVLAMIDD